MAEFTLLSLQKPSQQIVKYFTSKNKGICQAVLISLPVENRTIYDVTYKEQNNRRTNVILNGIFENGTIVNNKIFFNNKKEFYFTTQDKGKFFCKIIEENAHFVILEQWNCHFEKGISENNLKKFNCRGVFILK